MRISIYKIGAACLAIDRIGTPFNVWSAVAPGDVSKDVFYTEEDRKRLVTPNALPLVSFDVGYFGNGLQHNEVGDIVACIYGATLDSDCTSVVVNGTRKSIAINGRVIQVGGIAYRLQDDDTILMLENGEWIGSLFASVVDVVAAATLRYRLAIPANVAPFFWKIGGAYI